MGTDLKMLQDLIRELPPERREAVRAFVESLLRTDRALSKSKPALSWAGGLEELRGRYTSVELQHEVARARSGGE